MLSTQLMKLAERNQWKTNLDEQTVFGEFNGYLFTGLEGKGFKAFITPLAGIDPDSLQTLLNFLDKNYRVLHLRNYEITDNFLCTRQQEGLVPLSADKMEYLLAQISGLLSLGELPTGACAVCGEKATRKGLYYGLYCHLHPECQDREITDFTGLAADHRAHSPIMEQADDESADEPLVVDYTTPEELEAERQAAEEPVTAEPTVEEPAGKTSAEAEQNT